MKKNYSFYSLLAAIPLGLLILVGFTGGQPGQFAGSPGDGNANCTSCHAPGANFGGTPVLMGVPASYVPGQTYNLTLAINGSSRSKFGFNITAERAAGNAKVGAWTAGTGTQMRADGAGLTHTSAGTSSSSWNFTWVAPTTNQGNVTFYYSTIQANNAGGNNGDQWVGGNTMSTLGVANLELAQFKMYPTQVDNDLFIELENADNAQLNVYSLSGALVTTASINREDKISLTDLTSGMYLVKITVDGNTQTQRVIKN